MRHTYLKDQQAITPITPHPTVQPQFDSYPMTTLPNVSAIYRDLAFMAQGPTRHSEAPPSAPHYTQPVQQYSSKQARHNQLMEKLRNAQMECGGLNRELGGGSGHGGGHNQTQRPYQPVETQQYQQSFQHSYQPQVQSEYGGSGWGAKAEGRWQPPTMRYRHIQDFKSNQEQQEAVENMIQKAQKAALEKEFYEEQKMKPIGQSPPKPKEAPVEAQQPQEGRFDGVSETSYGRTWANRESKFQDKLQSYYQLCKRRPVSSKMDPQTNPTPNKNKYMRIPNRNTVMELDQAIRLLSYD